MSQLHDEFAAALGEVIDHVSNRDTRLSSCAPIPPRSDIDSALAALPATIPADGLGVTGTIQHLLDDLTPGLLQGHAGSRFFGLVTGGVTPASQLADILGTSYDESLQINFPDASVAVALEQRALDMVLDLLDIPRETFAGRSVTTGATASNIMGLACARDALLLKSQHLPPNYSIAEQGFPAPISPGEPPIKVITVKAHGSILKAAAVTGIGRANVHDLPCAQPGPGDPWGLGFDLEKLESQLRRAEEIGQGIIVVVTLGEVNTGGFTPNIRTISDLCKRNHAWLHIDAAFGGFAALLPQYAYLAEEMALADSLTLDAHKWLNVPYDTAIFYTRHSKDLQRTFGPSPRLGTPAYLQVHTTPASTSEVAPDVLALREWHASLPSPLNCGIENSRRFRALPLYAGLMEQGKAGYADIVAQNCNFAQQIAGWMSDRSQGGQWYTVINADPNHSVPLNIVLFRSRPDTPFPPHDVASTPRLLHAINSQRLIYVTATSWEGVGALRIAVSNWRTGLEGDADYDAVVGALSGAMRS